MNETSNGVMYWTPRVLCIAFAALLAAFAADVFDMPLNVWEKAVALLLHLIPSLMVLAVLAVVWRHERIAVVLFPLLAAVHLLLKWGQLHWMGVCLYRGASAVPRCPLSRQLAQPSGSEAERRIGHQCRPH